MKIYVTILMDGYECIVQDHFSKQTEKRRLLQAAVFRSGIKNQKKKEKGKIEKISSKLRK